MDSTPMTTTSFSNRCFILGELWISYRDAIDFEDFIEYNDLGLPLAYAIANEIVVSTANSEMLIDETWELFLGALEIEDKGFESINEVLNLEEESAD